MITGEKLYSEIGETLTEKVFLKQINMTEEEMLVFLEENKFADIAEVLAEDACGGSLRFSLAKTAGLAAPSLGREPAGGWLPHTYQYVLGRLFPAKKTISDEDAAEYARGRSVMLQLARALHAFEVKYFPFDPVYDMHFLRYDEIVDGGYNQEYLRFTRLLRQHYVYEFMRIGTEITPFNTLGHIAGVHYVAMHAAYQLASLGVPVDLGLVSGAAAGHDIGKYGCKKNEERRIPYLHYYYTNLILSRLNMPMIAHIAANHSTWDLEPENLSVESLLLIYADFRVKSSRLPDGREAVNFYSLADAFQVILDKLDNVDAAKEKRYRKVYNKLRDFEDYMIDLGVDVNLPDVPAAVPPAPESRIKKDSALMSDSEAVKELKHAAVAHNTRLMNLFHKDEEFTNFLETARSETGWLNLRMYISIFGEYSTYMTEKQKLLAVRFLSELMVHRESDIRSQAADVTGQIIARFNEEYKKEVPDGEHLPEKEVTNFSLWEDVITSIMVPDHKFTEKHKGWLAGCLKSVSAGLLRKCPSDMQGTYIDILLRWYEKEGLSEQQTDALLDAALIITHDSCTAEQMQKFMDFAGAVYKNEESGEGRRIAAVEMMQRFNPEMTRAEYCSSLKGCLGLDPQAPLPQQAFSEMFLSNMKARTSWAVKIANIRLMLDYLEEQGAEDQALHVAAHLANLIKVSETVTVRKGAGDALISIIGRLKPHQCNEIAVELGKGLEIGDYQFSKYIPQYLGIIMLHLQPGELDELITDLKKLFEQAGPQVAGAVLHTVGVVIENYGIYAAGAGSGETDRQLEARRTRLIRFIVRGFAHYNIEISQEALWTMGEIFASPKLSLDEKYGIMAYCGKKFLTLHHTNADDKLDFFYNAAVLSQVYRFICAYELENGEFRAEGRTKVAFFPGTFDPFSSSHKAIAKEIRNMGFEVYLALDEFSWSKKTQPRLHRRKILEMSVADEENIYIFPDSIPVNIANPGDLKVLRDIFRGRSLYFAAGSDVIANASCYRAEPSENSIHSMNHIVFRRKSGERMAGPCGTHPYPVTGDVVNLQLEEFYEDISSTRIRENIDSGRDISSLIDPVAQSYIEEHSLYLREPTYKHILQARELKLEPFGHKGSGALDDLREELEKYNYDTETAAAYLDREDVQAVVIRDAAQESRVIALAAAHSEGSTAVIGTLFFSRKSSLRSLGQMVLVELLTELVARGFTRAEYRPEAEGGMDERTLKIIERQGFRADEEGIIAADISSPVIVFKNVDTIIKNPLSKNKRVLAAVENAHNRLLSVLTEMNPGQLVISFNSTIMHHKLIQLLAQHNHVPAVQYAEKKYGPYMAVPFSTMLESIAVPNTVTKDLYTEKYFSRSVETFTIEEMPFYSSLDNQVKTIKSFNRPVLLVDDLLHKGYRMKNLEPIIKANNLDVECLVMGVSTARGRRLAEGSGFRADSAYYLPDLKFWLDETDIYPYIGGDGLKDPQKSVKRQGEIPSINLILPYAVPTFLGKLAGSDLYKYSMTCLENARDILRTLEEEYEKEFTRKLTLKRIGEVIAVPKRPEADMNKAYNENIAPSVYVEQDIEKLIRLRKMFI